MPELIKSIAPSIPEVLPGMLQYDDIKTIEGLQQESSAGLTCRCERCEVDQTADQGERQSNIGISGRLRRWSFEARNKEAARIRRPLNNG
jgi:hypothetical protein